MIAVPTAATKPSATISTREYMAEVTPMSRTWPARSANSSRSRSCLPKSFTTSAPATLNRSAIVLLIDALRLKPSRVMTCSFRPMRRAGMMNAGSTTSVRSVRRHSSPIITARVIARVIAFWTTVPMVFVTACCAPMTSPFMRLISAPVCTRVKNEMGSRWTWSKSATRMS